jgi:hypothetical protein
MLVGHCALNAGLLTGRMVETSIGRCGEEGKEVEQVKRWDGLDKKNCTLFNKVNDYIQEKTRQGTKYPEPLSCGVWPEG